MRLHSAIRRSSNIVEPLPGARIGCSCRALERFRREPGGPRDIHATAQGQYHVTFPITDKVAVKGKDAHPFYKWAAAERPLETPRWNFHKYLVGRDGYLRGAYPSAVEPTHPPVIAAIEKELDGA